MLFAAIDHLPVAAFIFPVSFAILVLSLSSDTGSLSVILNTKPFQILGARSYSIYLLHMPLLLIFENVTKRANGLVSSALILLAYIGTLIAISGWSYRFIESPARDWFNRRAAGTAAARSRIA